MNTQALFYDLKHPRLDVISDPNVNMNDQTDTWTQSPCHGTS